MYASARYVRPNLVCIAAGRSWDLDPVHRRTAMGFHASGGAIAYLIAQLYIPVSHDFRS